MMNKKILVTAYDKLISQANCARAEGDLDLERELREEAKFVMNLIIELS